MSDVPLTPAATILLVRDAPSLEVLMVQRHHKIDFMPGALVFPGGKTSDDDADPAWVDHADGAELPDRSSRICAIREAFEESGVLLARPAGARGSGAAFAPAAAIDAIAHHREAIDKGQLSFLKCVCEAKLILALDALTPYAHWLTPKGMPKRFDTRFYIASAPSDQLAACDGREAVDACWIAPETALSDATEGKRTIVFPTRLNVSMLARSKSVAEALAASRARKIVLVEPQVVREAGAMVMTIPAEADYGVTREPMTDMRP